MTPRSTSVANSVYVTQSTASVPSSPDVTLQGTGIVNSANITRSAISVPVVTSQSTTVATSNNVTLSSQPTPEVMNFETVTTSLPQTQAPPSGILNPDQISFIRLGCCSRRNFAAKLVVALFDEDTRKRSNVSGKLGKMRLNPVLIQYVKSLAFQFYPLEHDQSEKAAWGKCIISIDEINRRLNKPVRSDSTE